MDTPWWKFGWMLVTSLGNFWCIFLLQHSSSPKVISSVLQTKGDSRKVVISLEMAKLGFKSLSHSKTQAFLINATQPPSSQGTKFFCLQSELGCSCVSVVLLTSLLKCESEKSDNNKYWWRCGESEGPSYIVDGNVKRCSHFGRQSSHSSNK